MNVAIIPAKSDSSRLPNKNMLEINGKPLLWYAIEYAKYYWSILPDIYVSTDSKETADYAKSQGAKVVMRGSYLCGDIPLLTVYGHALAAIGGSYDYVVGIQPDHPGRAFTLGETLKHAHKKDCDLLMTTDKQVRPNGALKIIKTQALVIQSYKTVSRYLNDCVNIHTEHDLALATQEINRHEIFSKTSPAKRNILVTAPVHFMPGVKDIFRAKGHNAIFASNISTIPGSQDIDTLIPDPGAPYRLTDKVLVRFPNLRTIITPSTGTNHIDRDYCDYYGIDVKGLLDNRAYLETISASAEYTMALALALIRKIPQAVNCVKNGHWRDVEDVLRGVELKDKKVAIVGYGRIGKKLSWFLRDLVGLKNLSVFDKEEALVRQGVVRERQMFAVVEPIKDLFPVLASQDIVFICLGLNKDTERMVDHTWFKAMKDGVYFINTSRGEIVDELALISALERGKVNAAAVDVVCDEANYQTNSLIAYAKEHNNLIVTPHIAGATIESQKKAMLAAIDLLDSLPPIQRG